MRNFCKQPILLRTVVSEMAISQQLCPKLPETGVYNPPMNFWLRLAIMSTPFVIWGVLYLACRLSGISPARLQPWLRIGFRVLVGASLIEFVFDRSFLSNIISLQAWGLFGANVWITRHYKLDTKSPITSLRLSTPEPTTADVNTADRGNS